MSAVVKDGKCLLFVRGIKTNCHLCLVGKAGEGFPERCPHGVRLESLPLPVAHGTFRKKDCVACPPIVR